MKSVNNKSVKDDSNNKLNFFINQKLKDFQAKRKLSAVSISDKSNIDPFNEFKIKLSKKDLYNIILPFFLVETLHNEIKPNYYVVSNVESLILEHSEKLKIDTVTSNKPNINNGISSNINPVTSSKSNINNHINSNNTTTNKKPKKSSFIRMLNCDCLMKKIKSRFFKYFANQYMIKFVNYYNEHKNSSQEKLFYGKIHNYFLVYATIQKHYEWNLLNKSIFEIFYDHSSMKLNELFNLFVRDRETFDDMFRNLDEITKFVILQPFKVVFERFTQDEELIASFIKKMKDDLIKRKPYVQNEIICYCDRFKENIFKFVQYYTNNSQVVIEC